MNFESMLKYIVVFILSFLSHIMFMSKIPTQQISEVDDHKALVFASFPIVGVMDVSKWSQDRLTNSTIVALLN